MERGMEKLADRLKEDEEKLRSQMQAARIDLSDSDSLDEMIDGIFRERIRAYREIDQRNDVLKSNDWSDIVLERRKQAVRRLTSDVTEKSGEKFPALCVGEEFVRISAPCSTLTFDGLNREYDVELAAAIWMLDYLDRRGLYEDAAAYFPQTGEELGDVYLPNLSDAAHSDDALRAMKSIIRNRNRGMTGSDGEKTWMDGADAVAESENVSDDRKRFDAVMAMIDADSRNDLRQRFISYFWELTDEILHLIEQHKNKANDIREKILAQLRIQEELCEKAQASARPPMAASDKNVGEVTVSRSGPAPELIQQLQAAKIREEALRRELRAAENDIEQIYRQMLLIPSMKKEEADDLASFKGLDVRCPFEMCFAFLFLLCENSDEVWSYNIAYDVLSYACQALPWAGCHVVDPDGDEDLQVDFDLLSTLAENVPSWGEDHTAGMLYEKRIRSPLVSPDSETISIAQLVFLASGLIPPRQSDMLAFTKILLGDGRMSESEADIWYAYIMLAYAVAHKEPDFTAAADGDQEDAEAQKNAEEEIRSLKTEIKNLKKRLHQLEHRNKEYSQELAISERERKAAVTELSELRTMIRESVNSDEEAPVSVDFPYTSKKRAVIIGGHPSWVNAVKPLLQNVRFISSSEQPHPGVIMNAERVWIQTNALGHSGYYKIIDIVRKNNIKVCYFRYSSAEKCAEQFALEDMEEDTAT